MFTSPAGPHPLTDAFQATKTSSAGAFSGPVPSSVFARPGRWPDEPTSRHARVHEGYMAAQDGAKTCDAISPGCNAAGDENEVIYHKGHSNIYRVLNPVGKSAFKQEYWSRALEEATNESWHVVGVRLGAWAKEKDIWWRQGPLESYDFRWFPLCEILLARAKGDDTNQTKATRSSRLMN